MVVKLVVGLVAAALALGCSKKSEAPVGGGSAGSNVPAVEQRDALVEATTIDAAPLDAVAAVQPGAPAVDGAVAAVAIDAQTVDAALAVPPPAPSGNIGELRASVSAVEAAFGKASAIASTAKTTKAACAGLAELGGTLAELGDVGPPGGEHEWQEAKRDAVDKLGQVLVLCNEKGRKPAEIVEGIEGLRGEIQALRGALRSN